MKSETHLLIPDTHVTNADSKEGGIDPAAESVLFQAIKIIKPDVIDHIGDIGEWESVSPWQWKRRKRPPVGYIKPMVDREAGAINTWLDKLEKAAEKAGTKSIHLIEGNHEVWANNFDEEEDLEGKYTAYNLLKVKERGHGWSSHGTFHKVGKLNLTHGGHFTGQHHAYKTVMGLSASCAYGHFHNTESAHVMHLGGTFGAWCMGCLCKMDKKFLNHRPTSWSHALGVVHLESDGTFHMETIEIFNGVAYVYGKRVEAKLLT